MPYAVARPSPLPIEPCPGHSPARRARPVGRGGQWWEGSNHYPVLCVYQIRGPLCFATGPHVIAVARSQPVVSPLFTLLPMLKIRNDELTSDAWRKRLWIRQEVVYRQLMTSRKVTTRQNNQQQRMRR